MKYLTLTKRGNCKASSYNFSNCICLLLLRFLLLSVFGPVVAAWFYTPLVCFTHCCSLDHDMIMSLDAFHSAETSFMNEWARISVCRPSTSSSGYLAQNYSYGIYVGGVGGSFAAMAKAVAFLVDTCHAFDFLFPHGEITIGLFFMAWRLKDFYIRIYIFYLNYSG